MRAKKKPISYLTGYNLQQNLLITYLRLVYTG